VGAGGEAVSEQPEALRLADSIEGLAVDSIASSWNDLEPAAAKLRRQHEIIAEQLEGLKEVAAEARHPDYDWSVTLLNTVHAAIKKAEEVKP
jgi:hypothetical protein